MGKIGKLAAGGFGLVAAGYALGILTAPKSGKETRKQIKETAKKSMASLEKDLKTVYSQTKDTLDKLAKQNPEITAKYNEAKDKAVRSQAKVKEMLSALHGGDNVDEDLDAALKSAKVALKELKQYIKK